MGHQPIAVGYTRLPTGGEQLLFWLLMGTMVFTSKGVRTTVLRPPIHQQAVVEIYFEVQGLPEYGTHRLLARPGQLIHVNLGDALLGISGETAKHERMTRHLVSGSRTGWFDSRPTGHMHLLGIGLTPIGLHALTGIPQHELCERDLQLDDLFPGTEVRIWYDQLAHAPDTRTRLLLLQQFVDERLEQRARHLNDNASGITLFALQHAAIPMKELERRTGYTRQYVLRLMRERTGLSTQEHHYVLRMQRTMGLLNDANVGITDVALAAGFYDQSHFNRHFKRFTGLTPSAFLAAERSIRNEPFLP